MDAEDQDDEFEDYNPHPYQGGYDIALTYGQPLPPSPAICYPIASPSPAAAPPPEKTPPAAAPLPPPPQEPKPVPAPPSAPVEAPKPAPEPEQHAPYVNAYNDSWYDYRCGYPEQSLWDLGYGERGYWRQLSRAADYLFGYSQGCGERIIGADRYGIPIYANKKHGHEEPLSVQIEPASAQKVDYYDASDDEVYPIKNWPEERIEKDGYYETDQPPYLQVNPIETFWSQEPSYNELYQEREYAQYEQCSSPSYDGRREESRLVANPSYAYQQHYYEQPLSIQLEPFEPSWRKNVYEYDSSEELKSSSYDCAYQRHYYEQPISVQHEPFEPSWQQKVNEYEVPEGHGNPSYAYGMHNYEQPLSVQLEPFETSWSRSANYYEVSEELSSLNYKWVDEKNHSENTIDDYKKNYNEPPHFDQLEPYEPTWTRIRCYYEPYNEEGYDSHEKNAALPFQNYEE